MRYGRACTRHYPNKSIAHGRSRRSAGRGDSPGATWPSCIGRCRRVPLEAFLPQKLELQEFGGTAVAWPRALRMAGVMRHPCPTCLGVGLSRAQRANVRGSRWEPGVWFLSLDAANHLAVWAGRRTFISPITGQRCRSQNRQTASTTDRLEWAPIFRRSTVPLRSRGFRRPVAGALVDRAVCLYAESPDGSIWRNDVHHHPWPLQSAVATIQRNTFSDLHGIPIREPPSLLHFARRLDVIVWNAERAA